MPRDELKCLPVVKNLIRMERVKHEQDALQSEEAIGQVAPLICKRANNEHEDVEHWEKRFVFQ